MNQPKEDYPSPEAEARARRMKRILLALPIAFLLLLWAGNTFIRWMWQPPIVIEGQVVDTEGKGVPDVFVIVNHWFDFYNPNAPWILAEGSTYSGLTCAPYSRVLQTDEQGRYYLRLSMHEAFGDQRYPSWKWRKPQLKFYKPGWQDIYRLSDGPFHSSFPMAPNPFVMQFTEKGIQTTLQRTGFTTDRNCDTRITFSNREQPPDWRLDPSWLRLYEAEYDEVWGAWCGEPGQGNFEVDDFRFIAGRLDWLAEFIEVYQLAKTAGTYTRLRDQGFRRSDKGHKVLRQVTSTYPWNADWYQPPAFPRPFDPEEKQALCEALRLENYVTEEHWP